MQALTGIEPLDIFHNRLPGFGLIAELPMPHEFVLPELKKLSTGALS